MLCVSSIIKFLFSSSSREVGSLSPSHPPTAWYHPLCHTCPRSAPLWPLMRQKSNPHWLFLVMLCPHILSKASIDHRYSNYKSLISILYINDKGYCTSSSLLKNPHTKHLLCLDLFNTVASDVYVNSQCSRPLIVRTRSEHRRINQKSLSADCRAGSYLSTARGEENDHMAKRMTPEGTEDQLCEYGSPLHIKGYTSQYESCCCRT